MNLVDITKTFIIGASISLFSTLVAFANTGVIQESANVYAVINDENTLIGTLNKDKKVTIVSEEEGWLKIQCDEFADVYIPKQYISIQEEKPNAVVTDESVNVRQEPSLDSAIIGKTDKDSNIVITAKVGEWYELDYNGTQAYIYGEYVKGDFLAGFPEEETATATPEEKIEEVKTVEINQNAELGQQVIEYAKQFIGTPYVYGSANLKSGTDCSGFTSSVMRNFGINLSRSSREQINNGARVNKSQLVVGDLVFFNPGGGGISHVGLYIGNGDFIHSSSTRTGGVIISNLKEAYYANTYVGASRVI